MSLETENAEIPAAPKPTVRTPAPGTTPGQPTSDRVPGEIKGDETGFINGGPIPPRTDHPVNHPERVYEKRAS